MKARKTHWIVPVAICLITLFNPFSSAKAGNDGGHGGDPYALELATLGEELARDMVPFSQEHPELLLKWGFTQEKFAAAVKKAKLVSDEGENVILDDNEMDAINYPDETPPRIKLNRTRWREDLLLARTKTALHEFFGIAKVEVDHYRASIDFAELASSVTRRIQTTAQSDDFMANLFYGRCLSIPALNDPATCGQNSPMMVAAMACAKTQAEGHCRLAGKENCDLVFTTYTAKMKIAAAGALRYCEVLTVMK